MEKTSDDVLALSSLELHLELGQDSQVNLVNEPHPSIRTNYTYSVVINNNKAIATASSQYGLMYALESFTQLVEATGSVPGHYVELHDSPQYVPFPHHQIFIKTLSKPVLAQG